MTENVNFQLREALSIVSALDARIDVHNVGMVAIVVFDQCCDIEVNLSALDATVQEN